MARVWALTQLGNNLATDPRLNGDRSAESKRSFLSKCRAIDAQLISQRIQLFGLKTGRHVMLPLFVEVGEGSGAPGIESTHSGYIKIKELLTSLEEDAVRVLDGDMSELTRKSYDSYAHQLRVALEQLMISVGVKRVAKRKVKGRKDRADG